MPLTTKPTEVFFEALEYAIEAAQDDLSRMVGTEEDDYNDDDRATQAALVDRFKRLRDEQPTPQARTVPPVAPLKTEYKGYTIEALGANYYITAPNGHRAFGEVAAFVETAKRWIDAEVNSKRRKA